MAAGLSRRMQNFKPLLPYGETTVIESTISRLQEGGVQEIVVVTGFLSSEIQRVLRRETIRFVHNPDYARTQMFESVKLGLMAVEGEEIFLVPVDLPEFDPNLLNMLTSVPGQAVYPVCHGKNGHPLLLRRSALEKVFQHNGARGLKGALDLLDTATVETEDQGCLMDIDTPEDYQKLLDFRARRVPSKGECEALFQHFGTTDRIRAHCEAVCGVAMRLADGICGIDKKLLRIASLIHDAARREPNHAEVLAIELERLGYARLASVVRVHMDLPDEMSNSANECSLLYLADKLVVEDRETGLDQRFWRAEEHFRDQPDALADIYRKKAVAQKVLDMVTELSGC